MSTLHNEEPLMVEFAGFGGYMDEPCYKDQRGRYYFDEGDRHGELQLYTGAYLDEACDEICGEPNNLVTRPVICKEPYVENPKKLEYMLLDRMRSDCEYFLGNGNGYEGHLYGGSIENICNEMKSIWESFTDSEKPEWLSLKDIADYKTKMLSKKAAMYA